MYAKAVGGGSAIVVNIAAGKTEKNRRRHPKSVTGRQKKEKNRIGRMKKEEGKNKNLKKPWMIGVQQWCLMMILSQSKCSTLHNVVIFVANPEQLSWNFPTESMAGSIPTLFLPILVNLYDPEDSMIQQKAINQERIRKIEGSFAWIPHTFMRQGFWSSLSHHELLLYLFLVLVSDRQGVSYYSFDRICSMLKLNVDEYIHARNSLIDKTLIAFDGYLFQVLSLPERVTAEQPSQAPVPYFESCARRKDPENIRQIFQRMFLDGKNNF